MKGVDEDWKERLSGTSDEQQRAHIATIATIILAGGAAVAKLYGTMRGVEMKLDIGAVRELLEDVAETDKEMDIFIDRCWEQAKRLVRKEWEPIKAVAAALIESKTLTGSQVGQVIERAKRRQRMEKMGQQKD
jgi:pheromone shutdown protein TraB